MIFIFICNTFNLQSKPFSVRAERAVVVLVRRFFIETMTTFAIRTWHQTTSTYDQENVSSKIIQNLLTITTQCTLNSTSQTYNLILWYPYLKTQCNSKMLLLKYIQTYLSYPDLLEGGAKGLIDCLIMKLRKQLSKRRKKSLGKICNMIFHGMFI